MIDKLTITEADIADDIIMLRVPKNESTKLKELLEKLKKGFSKDKKSEVKFDWINESRSLSANNYMWILCDKIAKKLNQLGQMEIKDTVYKRAIKDIGVFEDLPIKEKASANFIKKWQSNGLGWICEVERESTLKGFVVIRAFYGSSSYDTKEMSDLINYIVAQCEELGIETMPPNELKSLVESWGKSEKHNTE